MNTNDFRYMWCATTARALSPEDTLLLKPIDFRTSSKKHAVLLLHGFSSSPAVYRHFIPRLDQYDAIVCPLLPGHGETLKAFEDVKAEEWLQAAKTACNDLCKNYERVDVIGLSLGGVLAYHLAKEFKLNHLFLLAPATALRLNLSCVIHEARALKTLGFRYLRNRAGNLYCREYDELVYRLLPLHAVIELFTLILNTEITPLTCPVDVFLGHHDPIVDSEKVEQQFANQATIHWLKSSSHVLPLDGDREFILNTIINCNASALQIPETPRLEDQAQNH